MLILDPTDHKWNTDYRHKAELLTNKEEAPDGWEITWKEGTLEHFLSFNNKGILVYCGSRVSYFHSDTMGFNDEGKMTDWTLYDDEYYEQFETKFDDRGVVTQSNDRSWKPELKKRNERLSAIRNKKE